MEITKTIALLLILVAAAWGQPFLEGLDAAPAPAAAAPPLSVTRVQYSHGYPATSRTLTVTAGNTLVVFASGQGNLTAISDNQANTYQTLSSVYGSTDELMCGVATNCAGGSTTVQISGGSDVGLTVIEYSGVSGLASMQKVDAGSGPMAMVHTTSATCVFVAGWANERSSSFTSYVLNPGTIAGTLIQSDAGHYDRQYEWLAGGSGYSAGSWTNVMTSGSYTAAMVVGFALK